jgi:hypothetical protein
MVYGFHIIPYLKNVYIALEVPNIVSSWTKSITNLQLEIICLQFQLVWIQYSLNN